MTCAPPVETREKTSAATAWLRSMLANETPGRCGAVLASAVDPAVREWLTWHGLAGNWADLTLPHLGTLYITDAGRAHLADIDAAERSAA